MKNFAPLLLLFVPLTALAGARASHIKVDNKLGANFYAANAAIDGRLETVWLVPGESDNKGEWIEVDIPKGEVDKIAIYPGFGKSAETFADHPRVKQIRVDVMGLDDDQTAMPVGSATVDVADTADMQIIDIPDFKTGDGLFGGRVRFTIQAIYPGDDYPNLGVSEVLVILKEFDSKANISAVSGEAAGHEKAMMIDDNPKTCWATDVADAGLTLTTAGFGVSSVGFVPAGKEFARPKKVQITVGTVSKVSDLPDAPGVQWALVPGFNGYTGGGFGDVEVKILETWPGTTAQLGVAELKIRATNYEPI